MFSDSPSILIVLSLLITVFIAEFRKLESKPYIRLILLLCASFLTLWLTDWKDRKKDIAQKKEKASSDSLAQERIDRAVSRAEAAFGKAVGEYGIGMKKNFDGMYALVRDSAKRVINQMEDNDPYFGLLLPPSTSITIKNQENNRSLIECTFLTYSATATDVKLNMAFIIETRFGLQIIENINKVFNKSDCHMNVGAERKFDMNLSMSISDEVFIYMYGSYKNPYKTKTFFTNELYALSKRTGKSFLISSKIKEKINKVIGSDKNIHQFLQENGLELGT